MDVCGRNIMCRRTLLIIFISHKFKHRVPLLQEKLGVLTKKISEIAFKLYFD